MFTSYGVRLGKIEDRETDARRTKASVTVDINIGYKAATRERKV